MHQTTRRKSSRRAPVGVLAAAMALALSAAAPGTAKAEDLGHEGGLGVAAGLSTLIYAPAKTLYAGGGLLAAGLAWVFSGGDGAVVDPILNASVRGDYVVTPEHLEGKRPLEFVGRPPGDRQLGIGAQAGVTGDF